MREYPLPTYRDRAEAGKVLARSLKEYADQPETLVLGLARGGLPVAQAIAQALHLPLDVLLVRKLGVPGQEELAFGAIAAGVRVLNEDVVAALALPTGVIEETTKRQLAVLAQREAAYRGDRAPLPLAGRTVILVDDGLATGASLRAAIAALRQHQPTRIVVAVPVAAQESAERVAALAEDFVCPLTAALFAGVGGYYQDFAQVSDGEVQAILRQSAQP